MVTIIALFAFARPAYFIRKLLRFCGFHIYKRMTKEIKSVIETELKKLSNRFNKKIDLGQS